MDSILSSSSLPEIANPINNSSGSDSGFNKITIMLIIFLILACCLLCIGYDFNFSNMISSGTGCCACFILVCFLFYILWNHFYGAGSGNTNPMISQETKNKYMGQYKNVLGHIGNLAYNSSQGVTNPTLNKWSGTINQYGQRIVGQPGSIPIPVQVPASIPAQVPVQVPVPMVGHQTSVPMQM